MWNTVVRLILVIVATSLLTACGPAPLPESYGIYARDGRSLIRLDASDEPVRLGASANFVIFDKMIGSSLLGSGMIPLEEVFNVHEAAFVRFEVERVRTGRDRKITGIHLSPATSWLTLATEAELTFGPVDGEAEMLLITPSVDLAKGLYVLQVNDNRYEFAVGLDPDEVAESALGNCHDKHSDSRAKSESFSWAEWLSQTQGAEESSRGNWLEDTGYFACSVLDDEARTWRESAITALDKNDLHEAFAPARLFAAYDAERGRPILEKLLERARSGAQAAFADERWQEASSLAALALEMDPDEATLREISTSSDQKMAEIAAAAKAAEEARRNARIRASFTATETLGTFTVLSTRDSPKYGMKRGDRHVIEVTDVAVRGLAYLQDRGWITSTGKLDDEYWFCWISEEPVVPKELRDWRRGSSQLVANVPRRKGRAWQAVFETEEERGRFIDVLNRAKDAWYETHGDLVSQRKCPSTP